MISHQRPKLLFTIDVEEDMPAWKITEPTTVRNAHALPELARTCAGLGVKPTYLCSYPMVTLPESKTILQDLARRGGCEIATHLHPWNTPPYRGVPGMTADERTVAYYMSDLEPAVFREKLASLHSAVAEVGGAPPKTFRAGRFGISVDALSALIDFGYEVDTSVTPMVHHAEDGGPDFRSAPLTPYRPSAADVCTPGDLRILEIPVSISLTKRLAPALRRAYVHIPRRTRLRGLLSSDYLNVVDLAWLYPAHYSLQMMQKCARVLRDSGNPILNIFLHSSELVDNASSYIRTPADAKACLERIRGILEYCVRELGAEPATLRDAGRALGASHGLAPGA